MSCPNIIIHEKSLIKEQHSLKENLIMCYDIFKASFIISNKRKGKGKKTACYDFFSPSKSKSHGAINTKQKK